VSYDRKFYNDILKEGSPVITKLAFRRGTLVGAMTCEIQSGNSKKKKLYIKTLGCYAAHRRSGIGSRLLSEAIQIAKDSKDVDVVSLHVQATNEDAFSFYRRFVFEVVETKKNFYSRIFDESVSGKNGEASPKDALVLEKKIEALGEVDRQVLTSEN
jgi:ribosomal protein S18 acetylase RimI-like enzyme